MKRRVSDGLVASQSDLQSLSPAFERAARLAKALFNACDVKIILKGDCEGSSIADLVLASSEPIWIEDAANDPQTRDGPFSGAVRLLASAPIRIVDGEALGALCVVDDAPRTRDESLLGLLTDIADGLGEAFIRLEETRASREEALVADRILSAFISCMPNSLVMTDRNMRVLKASPHWMARFRLTEDQVIGRTMYEIGPKIMQHKDLHDRCLAGEQLRNSSISTNQRDGTTKWLEVDLIPWRDGAGEVGGMLMCAHNVTETVKALERLERSERRLKMAIDLADLHVWEIDYHNRTLEKVGEDTLFGTAITFEDVERDFYVAVHPDDRHLAKADARRRLEGHADDRLVVRANRDDGKEVWMSSAAEVVRGEDNRPERIVGVFQNITAAKRAEKALVEAKEAAEAANRSKSEFLANMSHEIRTPLNGVLGMTQVIEADELSNAQRERVKVVRESGTALLAILNDLLDLSKVQAGKLDLNPTDFDMAELAPVVAAAFDGAAAGKDIALEIQVEESAAGPWIGDLLRLRQVLSSLVSNAIKFTAQGRVTLSAAHDGQEMRFSVRDTGIGIEAAKIPLLFEKFTQEDASTTRRYGGTGLGLSICRELVDLMAGRIEVESEKGVGSVFTVVLPLPRGEGRGSAPVRHSDAEGPPIADRAIRILAAEDNPTNQLVLRSLLAPLGVELTVVGDGRAAVEAFQAASFDVILMDVQMPDMNGIEATLEIRALEVEANRARTPIFALSANVMTHQIKEYQEAGMDGYVPKPVEIEKLYGALDEALRLYPVQQDTAASAA